MKAKLKKYVYDSPLTSRGKLRKKIYVNNNNGLSGNKNNELKCLALREFTEQKKPIFNIEKIEKYKRGGMDGLSGQIRYIEELKGEYLDLLLDTVRIF